MVEEKKVLGCTLCGTLSPVPQDGFSSTMIRPPSMFPISSSHSMATLRREGRPENNIRPLNTSCMRKRSTVKHVTINAGEWLRFECVIHTGHSRDVKLVSDRLLEDYPGFVLFLRQRIDLKEIAVLGRQLAVLELFQQRVPHRPSSYRFHRGLLLIRQLRLDHFPTAQRKRRRLHRGLVRRRGYGICRGRSGRGAERGEGCGGRAAATADAAARGGLPERAVVVETVGHGNGGHRTTRSWEWQWLHGVGQSTARRRLRGLIFRLAWSSVVGREEDAGEVGIGPLEGRLLFLVDVQFTVQFVKFL